LAILTYIENSRIINQKNGADSGIDMGITIFNLNSKTEIIFSLKFEYIIGKMINKIF
jgi:hypothetical protein